MTRFDALIIGGGASGLACAVVLSRSKKLKIAIVEGGGRLGKKLSATGNGQGNISNEDMSEAHYFGGNVELAGKIACKNAYSGAMLFDCLFDSDEKGRIYPAGRQASALTDCFMRKIAESGVSVIFSKVTEIKRGFTVLLANGEKLESRYVIMCTGGQAQKQFGTDGSAYSLVTGLGHTLTPLYPSLVQIKTSTEHIKMLKGIRADCALTAKVGSKSVKTVRGDVIFTDYGVSGNAVFSISPYVTDKHGATLSIEFLPDFSAECIIENLESKKRNGVPIIELLSGSVHNQIGRTVIKRACSENTQIIVKTLKNFELPVLGTLGFDYAQVTKGGINMSEITDNLESKLIKNLFFAGEILDVDGDCGGYNLQWAFTSGQAVAEYILKND